MKGWCTPCARVVQTLCNGGSHHVQGWFTHCARVAYAVHEGGTHCAQSCTPCVQRFYALCAKVAYIACKGCIRCVHTLCTRTMIVYNDRTRCIEGLLCTRIIHATYKDCKCCVQRLSYTLYTRIVLTGHKGWKIALKLVCM